MFFDDDVVRYGQALTGSPSYLFGGEERVKYFIADLFRYPASGICKGDFKLVGKDFCGDGNAPFAFTRILGHFLGYGLGGIDEDIQKDLPHFIGKTGDLRQLLIKLLVDIGDVFPFVTGNRYGRFKQSVKISLLLLLASRMAELLHGEDYGTDFGDTFLGLIECFGHFLFEVLPIDLVLELFNPGE